MAWIQKRNFDQSLGGHRPGYCLQNVRLGFSIASKYDTAWNAWLNTQQHKDRNVPVGRAVPLYYIYYVNVKLANGQTVKRNYGHINVRLPNGQVWSDGDIFASIADYEAKKAPEFVGWGESVNGIRVVEYIADPSFSMPPVNSKIQLIPVQNRTTFRAGTTNVAGTIRVTDSSFVYTVRGYDPKFSNRVLINSKNGGGDGVALALFYTNGQRIDGWRQA